jgi:hypothetical protein
MFILVVGIGPGATNKGWTSIEDIILIDIPSALINKIIDIADGRIAVAVFMRVFFSTLDRDTTAVVAKLVKQVGRRVVLEVCESVKPLLIIGECMIQHGWVPLKFAGQEDVR